MINVQIDTFRIPVSHANERRKNVIAAKIFRRICGISGRESRNIRSGKFQ